MAAVSRDGRALQHAAVALRCDRAIVSMAVAETYLALQYASFDLQKDTELLALRESGRDAYKIKFGFDL